MRSVVTIARHLAAVAALPFTITVLVPLWIARGSQTSIRFPAGPADWAAAVAGVALAGIGLVLFASTLRLFVTVGRGTLAPWDPPKHLIVRGPYRYVRNPMISGVLFVLFGEALILRSWPQLQWALFFLVINLVYIPLFEEPQLADRFGAPYQDYCRNVRRFIPRPRPWQQERR